MSTLPRWKCHKEVRAAKIGDIVRAELAPEGATLILELPGGGTEHIDMPGPWMERFAPQVGGYLVVYGDGYHSYSPAQAFEEGYTLVEAGA